SGSIKRSEFVSQSSTFQQKENVMKLSARNQFQGTVTRITEGQAMAEVVVKVGSLEFVAAITEGSVKHMSLKVNDAVTVAVKATEVMIGK
ncbi:MAG TPA: TOBE domain-containing protein, partial [Nitrospira sp.]|nr:TOBE domain-containing protein [Nitrospira sp.]